MDGPFGYGGIDEDDLELFSEIKGFKLAGGWLGLKKTNMNGSEPFLVSISW